MPIRTTAELVGGIIQVEASISLDPFIRPASLLVDRIPTGKLSDETLTEIETWLAAHFYCMFKPRRHSERAGDVAATYETKIDLYLNLSRYGQMAVTLDTTGTLRSISSGKRKPTVSWLGQDLCNLVNPSC